MSTTKYMDEESVVKKGIETLMRELGPIETIRFMNMPKKRKMESVRRHRVWQKSLEKERFFAEVFNE